MGMVFHRLTYDVGHFVEAPILHLTHGVHEAALNGFQAIIQARNSALQNDITRVVQEVLAIHATHT